MDEAITMGRERNEYGISYKLFHYLFFYLAFTTLTSLSPLIPEDTSQSVGLL
jgi:hypothetical protein